MGVPKVTLHWRKTENDLRTIRTAARLFAEYLARSDAGRARVDDWVIDDRPPEDVPPGEGGSHHMGGTRMSSTPVRGVVDRDCRVFGQENLYIAGSSVFPSSGYCNPTLS
ncbi:MAG: GMC family oxidoreductase, partial [Dongiaceae bacterium]